VNEKWWNRRIIVFTFFFFVDNRKSNGIFTLLGRRTQKSLFTAQHAAAAKCLNSGVNHFAWQRVARITSAIFTIFTLSVEQPQLKIW